MRKSAPLFCALLLSLSARRAWIEIEEQIEQDSTPESLSARRAWIEMKKITITVDEGTVALRKESVDRNTQRRDFKRIALRRSPQGERG